MQNIQVNSPAKINFCLNILSKRSDGFHNLWTLLFPLLDLYDVISFRKANSDSFKYNKTIKELGEDNLIIKAKKIIETHCGNKLPVEIELTKNIPIGAGMGGGSSNAASTLLAINRLFELDLEYEQLADFALELGSDVPFFLNPKPSIGESRGEILRVVDFQINFPILIVNPGIHVSTKNAFENIKTYKTQFKIELNSPKNFSEIINLGRLFTNDFEDFIFEKFPEIEEIKKMLYKNGAGFSIMTGTGSTVFGIFENVNDAESAAKMFPDNYFIFISLPTRARAM
ncbi:MAG: 4-(cytidine 5'-diphospho)-2-C-methyl-D-erythritol kinase [Melioribacteraceae bacterium]|nr:4-(cytidine 5'-diphospho)-2-C-methyl-D-erythritol kinase [Melioribacteraceae bacterium]